MHKIESAIGFADSELDSYHRVGGELTVRVKTWNERYLVLRFRDVLSVRDLLAGDFSAVVRGRAGSSGFLHEALSNNYTGVPASHPYEVYSFLNNDDHPSLEVIAISCDVDGE